MNVCMGVWTDLSVHVCSRLCTHLQAYAWMCIGMPMHVCIHIHVPASM